MASINLKILKKTEKAIAVFLIILASHKRLIQITAEMNQII